MKRLLVKVLTIMINASLWVLKLLHSYRNKLLTAGAGRRGLDCFRYMYGLKIPGKAKRQGKGYLKRK